MTTAFVIGYDPGGNEAHGIAALEVREQDGRFIPITLRATTARTLGDVKEWLHDTCRNRRIVAAGIDTLTEWNSGHGGWRPADLWLRAEYPDVVNSIMPPNYISGAMALNGAALLTLFEPRFRFDGTMVTEAHPKVCFFALTGKKTNWSENRLNMAEWLVEELGVGDPATVSRWKQDDCFDAGVALLAALKGLNGDWKLDLHELPGGRPDDRVRFAGKTNFWWPDKVRPS